jgi:hypothetical protein
MKVKSQGDLQMNRHIKEREWKELFYVHPFFILYRLTA